MRLNGSTFLVRGVGAPVTDATVKRFHASGARIVIADTVVEPGRRLADELGGRVIAFRSDLSSESDVRAVVEEAERRLGRVNGLINFAASREAARPDVRDAETLSRIVSAGIVGNSNMIRLIARALGNGAGGQRAARAVIVNVSSPSAWPGQVESAEYAAYTAGLLSMSLWIAREAAALGVRVITLASCPTHRPLVFQWPPEPGGDQSDRLRGLTRVEQPEEYASLVHQLVEGETAVTKGTQADGLSQREVEVLKLVAEGKTNKEIGALLGISARTVQVHTSNIYGKIRVGNRAAAALWLSKRDYELQSQSDRSLEVLLSGLSETRPFDRNRASRVVLSVTA